MTLREEERRNNFKKTVGNDDGRRRRQETTRQIRKAKKDENLLKRRMAAPTTITPASSTDDSEASIGKKNSYNVTDIPELTQMLKSPTATEQQKEDATRGFRKILSVERNPPVDAVLQAGVLSDLINNLTANPQASNLIFESAWALTNIASTTQTGVVVNAGGVGPLLQLLKHAVGDIREQAAWCLGNIAGDNTSFRDHLLQAGALEPLLMNVNQPENMSLLGNVTWTLSNLCRGKPAPPMQLVGPAVQPLANLLRLDVSVDVMVDAVWALSYLSDGPNENISTVMTTGITPRLIEFLSEKNSPLLTPTIRCLGNFVTGSDDQTQAVLDAGILDYLSDLLESQRKTIRKETCWLASNITAGTQAQISMLMQKRGLLQSLIDNAMNASWEVRKEAIWALSNICTTGDDTQVMSLVQCEGLQPLAEVLSLHNADATVLVAALDAIEQVLQAGERQGRDYCQLLDEYNGIDYLENLQEHPSNAVYEKAVKMIETYFGAEEQEDENLAPTMTDSGTFGFGLSSPKQLFPTEGAQAPVFQFGNVSNRAF